MRLPLGLDLKSLIVGAVIAMYVLPWLLGMFNSRRSASPTPAV